MMTIILFTLAVLCMVYGMIVGAAGSGGTKFFIVWLGMAVVFAACGIAVKKGALGFVPKPFKMAAVILCSIVLVSFAVTEGFVISQMKAEGRENLDYIIVLGAQVHKDKPSVVLKYRLDKAAEYLENNPETVCIVSGGQGTNEPFPEAEGMAAYLAEHHIPKERILLETESRTTEENIKNSMAYIEKDASVGVVTNDFHMFRALQIARKQGLENVCGIAADSTKFYLPNNMFREYLAEIKFLLKSAVKR